MLSLDVITLGVPEVQAAHAFYAAAFSPIAADQGRLADLDMHGAGQVALHRTEALAAAAGAEPATSGFRGYIVSYIVSQPSEVEALLAAAVRDGAKVLKPAKKGFWGGFSAALQTPDGSIWKLAAPSKKNTAPAEDPPRPTETAVLLGVAEPKASKAFYAALGMTIDRDYGNKYIDFRPNAGASRLGLMRRTDIAKDVGVGKDGSGFRALVLTCKTGSRQEVDALLAAAVSAGGRIAVAAGETGSGYAGYFADPEGFLWQAVAA